MEFVSLSKVLKQKKYSGKVLIAVIFFITICVYFNSLNNGFVNDWDDGIYVTNNPDITPVKGQSLINNAFTKFSNGHYHPLTTISYGIEYRLFGLEAKPFHVFNLLFHLLNVLLFFVFIRMLMNNVFIAFLSALLFAVHPMHVESVAWISDRKDLLCSMCFIGAMCTYLLYLKKDENKYYGFTFLLFVLALLSKAMAVTLPLVLFLLDYYRGKKFSTKTVIEKIPFLILSIVFGYISILAQKSNDALGDITALSLVDRAAFSGYSLVMYLLQLFWFKDMSAFYNYPIMVNGKYPVIYYILPIVLIVLFYIFLRMKEHRKAIVFSFGFFLITIALVLQIVPAGNVIMADRYTYLPYLGLFFFIAFIASNLVERHKKYSKVVYGVLFVYSMGCCYFSFERTKVWRDSMALWNDTLKKNPEAALPYSNRAALFISSGQFGAALSDLNKAILLRPEYVTPYYNRAIVLMNMERYEEAISDFTFVSEHKCRDIVSVLMQRGDAFMRTRNYINAVKDFSSVIEKNPNLTQAYYNRGLVFYTVNEFGPAIEDFTSAIKQNPNFAQAYYLRGLCFYKAGNFNQAYNDITYSAKLGYRVNPNLVNELISKLQK